MDSQGQGKYDFIVVDISNIGDEEAYPPKQFTDKTFIQKCLTALTGTGVLIYNTIIW